MSEVERRKGKLIPTEMTFEKVLQLSGIPEKEYLEYHYDKTKQSNWYECLLENDCEYLFCDGKWYEIHEELRDRNNEYFEDIVLNEDGTVDYHCQFYNGGTCLFEILEDHLKKK